MATPREAPAVSRAYILTPTKLEGRETHLLSTPERDAALLGLYCPCVIGLQEQRMLSPEPATHPLWTYHGIDRSRLPSFRGVIEVADRLGYLDMLPRIWVPDPERPNEKIPLVFPWLGDLLWAVANPDGLVYCVNWSVKNTQQAFERNSWKLSRKNQTLEVSQKLLARHEIEVEYHLDAKIRTVRIAAENIDRHVTNNLRQLFLHHRRLLTVSDSQRAEIIAKLQYALETEVSPAEVITILVERRGYSIDECRSVFYQAIWDRELRVDLFRPILINCIMRPETRDVAEVYAEWFQEAP